MRPVPATVDPPDRIPERITQPQLAPGKWVAADVTVTIQHVGQGSSVQAPHTRPGTFRCRQRGQASGAHTIYPINGHDHLAHPDGQARRAVQGDGVDWGQTRREFPGHAQAHLSLRSQPSGQCAGAKQPAALQRGQAARQHGQPGISDEQCWRRHGRYSSRRTRHTLVSSEVRSRLERK